MDLHHPPGDGPQLVPQVPDGAHEAPHTADAAQSASCFHIAGTGPYSAMYPCLKSFCP